MRHFLRVLLDPFIAVGLVTMLPTTRDGPSFVCSGRIGRGQSLSSGALPFFKGPPTSFSLPELNMHGKTYEQECHGAHE